MKIRPAASFNAHITPPGDKSITHRAFLLGSLAKGVSTVENASTGEDCASTRRCLETLGTRFEDAVATIRIHGGEGRSRERVSLDCGNSGTTMRLLMGILAGAPRDAARAEATLWGDASLNRRPMERVARPLRQMGAQIETSSGAPPVRVVGSPLRGASLNPEAASAQIKSAILLAGLNAEGTTTVHETVATRDHTERMIGRFGGQVRVTTRTIEVSGPQVLSPAHILVPGDPSSAAAFVLAALILRDSEATIENVLLNPHRIRYLDVLREMGADITIEADPSCVPGAEPRGRIVARSSHLRGVSIAPVDVPALVDELPLLAVAGAYADGQVEVRGAGELRLKESDRIDAMARGLSAMGANIEERADGFLIRGGGRLRGCEVSSQSDHRIAMALAIAGLGASGVTEISGAEAVSISLPMFFDELSRGVSP